MFISLFEWLVKVTIWTCIAISMDNAVIQSSSSYMSSYSERICCLCKIYFCNWNKVCNIEITCKYIAGGMFFKLGRLESCIQLLWNPFYHFASPWLLKGHCCCWAKYLFIELFPHRVGAVELGPDWLSVWVDCIPRAPRLSIKGAKVVCKD